MPAALRQGRAGRRPSRLWAELTTTDLSGTRMADEIAVLPLAATEQHGPHLPLGTDVFIMEGYLARVLQRLPAERPGLFLPVQSIGASIEHTDFAGTLSLPARAALDAWQALAEDVLRTGCRKLVLISSHGGNGPLVDILAHELRARHGCLSVRASWQRFGYPDGLFGEAEKMHGVHGGEIETSLMLAFRPDLVRMDAARDFVPASIAMERDHAWLRASGRPTGIGWMAQDLSREGPAGNAAQATAAKGEACADFGADAFVALLRDIETFDLGALERGPGST